jgi:hypothetical protein
MWRFDIFNIVHFSLTLVIAQYSKTYYLAVFQSACPSL